MSSCGRNAEEQPLNFKCEEKKSRKLPSTESKATIRIGGDGVNTNEIGLNINTNLTVSTSKMYKILLSFSLFLVCFVIIVGSLALVYMCNELRSLKTELLIIDQKIENKMSFVSRPSAQASVARTSQGASVGYEQFQFDSDYKPLYEDQARVNMKQFEPSPAKTDANKRLLHKEELISTGNMSEMGQAVSLLRNISMVHFIGALPDINLREGGPIGPWFMDGTISLPSATDNFDLSVDAESVIVNKRGVYFIYAQMLYLTRQPSCYFVFSRNYSDRKRRILAQCCTGNDSTPFNGSPGEMSCSVSTVAFLNRKDLVYLVQREFNRTFSMSDGQSYFGLINLS